MRKSCSTCIITIALVCLLNLGPSPAGAYYPILQATATYTSHSVTYSVYNPMTLQNYGSTLLYLSTVVDLQQHNGVIAWELQDGTDYYVNMLTFDPALNKFHHASQGPFSMVSNFQVMDGVVAYCIIDSSGNAGFNYATFDPAKGAWQQKSFTSPEGSGANFSSLQVTTKEGVVALSYKGELSGDDSTTLRLDI